MKDLNYKLECHELIDATLAFTNLIPDNITIVAVIVVVHLVTMPLFWHDIGRWPSCGMFNTYECKESFVI